LLEDSSVRKSLSLTLAAACGSLLLAGPASAASDYLLEIDSIKGEAAVNSPPKSIEVSSFSWGMSQASGLRESPSKASLGSTLRESPAQASQGSTLRESPTKVSQASGLRESPTKVSTGKPQQQAGALSADQAVATADSPAADTIKTFSLTVAEPGNETAAYLVQMCASGKHIPRAVLTSRKGRYEMTDVMVTSCVVSGNERRHELTGHVTLIK
jgi:type VI protein secretion system component Hcp